MKNLFLIVFVLFFSCNSKNTFDNQNDSLEEINVEKVEIIDSTGIKKGLLHNEFLEIKSNYMDAIESEDVFNIIYLKERYNDKIKEIKLYDSSFVDLDPIQITDDQIEQLEYKNVKNSLSINDIEEFIYKYPNHENLNKLKEKLIQLKVDQIFDSEETGEIPESNYLGSTNGNQAKIQIKNDTGCELTIRYSGPNVREYSIQPSKTLNFILSSGSYKVTASACGADYAGLENLAGQYSVSYYIQTIYR